MIIPFYNIPNPEGLADYWKATPDEKARIKDVYEAACANEAFEDDDDDDEVCDCKRRVVDLSFG